MKNLTFALLFLVALVSCKKDEVPVPPTTAPTHRSMTALETSLCGDWKFDKKELIYTMTDTTFTVLLETHNDSNCHVNFCPGFSTQPGYTDWMEATEGLMCVNQTTIWREVNSNGFTCINLKSLIYHVDTISSSYMVLRYPGDQVQSSYTYYYFTKL